MNKSFAAALGLTGFLLVFFAILLGLLTFTGRDLSLHQKEKRHVLGAVYMTYLLSTVGRRSLKPRKCCGNGTLCPSPGIW